MLTLAAGSVDIMFSVTIYWLPLKFSNLAIIESTLVSELQRTLVYTNSSDLL